MKKTWKVPVTWEVCGEVDIEANSLEEAVEIFKEKMDEVPLPSESYYIDGSFRLTSENLEELRSMVKED